MYVHRMCALQFVVTKGIASPIRTYRYVEVQARSKRVSHSCTKFSGEFERHRAVEREKTRERIQELKREREGARGIMCA